jgi:hypothetical protein
MSGNEAEQGFLARWSRRKREAAAEAEPPGASMAPDSPQPEAPPPEAPAAADAAAPEHPRPTCPIPNLPDIDPASLPPIETLTAESDFSLFLRPGVPAALRSAALRRMWSLDPAIRDYIGPVEYQWDFNAPGGLPLGFAGELVGDVKKLLAQAIGEAPAQPPKGEEIATPASDEEAPQEPPAALPAPPPDVAAAPEAEAEAAPFPTPAEPAAPPRRRHGSALPA